MAKFFSRVFKSYFETIVEIIEDQPNFTVPLPLYALLIVVFFCQISGYIFSADLQKPINDDQFKAIGLMNEVSTGLFLLSMKGNDTLTLVGFAAVQFIIYFYYFYVGVLTYLRNYRRKWLEANSLFFKNINQMLNVFFTFYYWIFQIPSLEINIQMLSCNRNSFLKEYQTSEECQNKPVYYIILAAIGCLLTIITGFVVLYFFRNYQFSEQNYLKRVFSYLQVLQLIFFFAFMFFYYVPNTESIYFANIQGIGIVQLLDLIYNQPYVHDFINIIYTFSTCFFEISMLILTMWVYTNLLKPYEVLFLILIFSSLFYFVIRVIQINQYLELTYIDFRNLKKEKILNYLNAYLELMYKLTNEQEKNEVSKFKIFEMLNLHQQQCLVEECICKISSFKDKRDHLNTEDVYILIEQLFQRYLKMNLKNVDREQIEYTYLKYITYLTRTRNRPTKAYYELMQLLSSKSDNSFYFSLIQDVLSQYIERNMIMNQKMYHKTKVIDNYQEVIHEELDTHIVTETEKIKKVILPELTSFLKQKIEFWRKLLEGNQSIKDFSEQASKLASNSRKIQKLYSTYLSSVSNRVTVTSNIVLAKIIEIYKFTVTSDYLSAYKFSSLFNSILNRDLQKSQLILNCYSIISGDVQILQMSLTKDHGKIINEKSEGLANFFGYSQKEFYQVNSVNNLMPTFISSIHDNLMNNMVQRGFSPIISDKIVTFIQNKKYFIEPINLYLQNYHTPTHDFCLQAILLKLVSPKEYIVFDEEGFIQGITEKMFELLFKKREKYDGDIKRTFHVGGPHPILGDNVIEQSEFFNKFNILLLVPQMIKILKKYWINQQSVKTIYSKAKHFQKKINIMLDANLVDHQTSVCMHQHSDIFIPTRIFHLNNMYSNIHHTPSHSFQKRARSQEHVHKTPAEIEQFIHQHQSDYQDDEVYSQATITYNLQEKIYSYQDQNQQNILKRTVFIMEIIEKTDLTSNQAKDNSELLNSRIDEYSKKLNQQSEGGQQNFLSVSALDQDKQFNSQQSSNNSQYQGKNQRQAFPDTSQEGDSLDPQQQSPIQNMFRFKKVESQQTFQRFSEPFNRFDQPNGLQKQISIASIKEKIPSRVSPEAVYNHIKTFKQKFKSLNNISNQMNNHLVLNQYTQSQKNISYIINGEDSIRNQREYQLNRTKDESKAEYFSDQKLMKHIPFSEMNNQQPIQESENEIFYQSTNTNRLTSAREKIIINSEEVINQQNFFTMLSPRQIQSNDHLMSTRELINTPQNQLFLSSQQLQSNKLRESFSSFKNDQSLVQDDTKTHGRGNGWNRLFQDAKKIMNQDGKRQPNKKESSSSSVKDQKNGKLQFAQFDNEVIAERASQSVTSLGSKLNSFSQQIIQDILQTSSVKNKLLMLILFVFFLGTLGLFSYLFYNRVQSFLNNTKDDIKSSYVTSFTSIFALNQTNNAYNLFLMGQPIPLLQTSLIKSRSFREVYSCVANGMYYNSYIDGIFNTIDNYQQSYPHSQFSLNIFSSNKVIEAKMNMYEGYWLYSNSALYTCQVVMSTLQFTLKLDGLYFQIANLIEQNTQTYSIINNIIQNASNNSSGLLNSLEIILYCSIGLCSCCFMIVIYIFRRASFYRTKVLLLVSRISFSEIEKEAIKVENCVRYLESPKEEWIKKDFISLTMKDTLKSISSDDDHPPPAQKKNRKKVLEVKSQKSNQNTQQSTHKANYNAQNNNNNHTNKTSISQSFSSPIKKNHSTYQRQKILSSSFTSRNLMNIKQIIAGGSLFTSGFLFIGIALLISLSEANNFSQAVLFYQETLTSINSVSTIIAMSQILLTQLYMQQSPVFVKLDFQSRLLYYQQQLANVQSFQSNYLENLSKISQIESSYTDQIFNLFQKDLCNQVTEPTSLILNSFILYQFNTFCGSTSSTRELLSTGVIGVVNQYIHYATNLIQFLSNANWTNPLPVIEQMIEILNSNTHVELITDGFNAPLNALTSINDVLNKALENRSNKYITIFEIYFLVLGPILVLITFFLILIYTIKMQDDLVDINFTLTLIPYDRLLDENTVNMLKLLKQLQ